MNINKWIFALVLSGGFSAINAMNDRHLNAPARVQRIHTIENLEQNLTQPHMRLFAFVNNNDMNGLEEALGNPNPRDVRMVNGISLSTYARHKGNAAAVDQLLERHPSGGRRRLFRSFKVKSAAKRPRNK